VTEASNRRPGGQSMAMLTRQTLRTKGRPVRQDHPGHYRPPRREENQAICMRHPRNLALCRRPVFDLFAFMNEVRREL